MGKHVKTGERIKQNHLGSKNGWSNNKEITKGDNPGVRKPRKEIRSHRCKHHKQNTRDRRENLRCRRFHREHRTNNQRKWKMQKDPNPNIQEIQDTMRRPNLRIIGVDEIFNLKGQQIYSTKL